jgi:hypothetical protein
MFKRLIYNRIYLMTIKKPRFEKDTFGPIEVPGDKYWGA